MVLMYIDLELHGKNKNGEWFLYKLYATPSYVIITKRYYCRMVEEPKEYIVEDKGHAYRVESVMSIVLLERDKEDFYKKFLTFLKETQKEGVERISTAHGLWCAELDIIPREKRKKFEELVKEKLGEVSYYYSNIIPYTKFMEVLKETYKN